MEQTVHISLSGCYTAHENCFCAKKKVGATAVHTAHFHTLPPLLEVSFEYVVPEAEVKGVKR